MITSPALVDGTPRSSVERKLAERQECRLPVAPSPAAWAHPTLALLGGEAFAAAFDALQALEPGGLLGELVSRKLVLKRALAAHDPRAEELARQIHELETRAHAPARIIFRAAERALAPHVAYRCEPKLAREAMSAIQHARACAGEGAARLRREAAGGAKPANVCDVCEVVFRADLRRARAGRVECSACRSSRLRRDSREESQRLAGPLGNGWLEEGGGWHRTCPACGHDAGPFALRRARQFRRCPACRTPILRHSGEAQRPKPTRPSAR